jgi:alpha-tubulin suppressor-like RCC1 family protein
MAGSHLGHGFAGQEDIGDDEAPSSVSPILLGDGATDVVGGARHTCALLSDGAVRCWGGNQEGQLGYGHTDEIADPSMAGDVELGGPAKQIAAGWYHTCALLEDGTVRCWGAGTSEAESGATLLGYGNEENVGDDEVPAAVGPVPIW